MGIFTSKKKEANLEGQEVTFDHFQVLRAIGRGSFGKVCIVQKKSTKQMFAMKYMNKLQCDHKDSLTNVFREIEILASVSHPFLVNLWFSFQDAEDMFMVVDLLLGGDLRYHLHQGVTYTDQSVQLYLVEAAAALHYLHQKGIVHRDIKPDNLLLDEEGHIHLTDFNIAAILKPGQLATSMSGTKPYMAPEIFECAADNCVGYACSVDWWSLGVTMYEVRRGKRPYDIHSSTSLPDVRQMFNTSPKFSSDINAHLVQLIARLLTVDTNTRLQSLAEILESPFMAKVSIENVLEKKTKPAFTPPKDHLNCDPSFELEEMIIEEKPLHKKKHRLSKQKSLTHTSQSGNTDAEGEKKYEGMLVFNREVEERKKERERREREREERERKWQEELEESMKLSDPTGQGCSFAGSNTNTPIKNKFDQSKNSAQVTNSAPQVVSGHQVSSGQGVTLTLPLSEDDLRLSKALVSPSKVKARIARSPKVKVRGTTITLESPRSSSSLTHTSTNYFKEKLKELQAEQKRTKTETQTTTSQSQPSTSTRPANHRQAVNLNQSEQELQDAGQSEREVEKNRTQEEEEEELCLHSRRENNNKNNNNCRNSNSSGSSNSSNSKRWEKRR